MASSGVKSDEPPNPQDLATAYRELSKGEQTASQLEASLTNLESKLDAMLAAFEQQEHGQGSRQAAQSGEKRSKTNGAK